MDKYPQGSQSTYTKTYTFCNLSHLCKTLHFQFLSILTHITSHSPHLESVLHTNNFPLLSLLQQHTGDSTMPTQGHVPQLVPSVQQDFLHGPFTPCGSTGS
ncbi:uncharacterized protein ACA1_179950 [Acanthamoeba castellanii str. Neff]|uniref:Uncharacterized protein n=1 Tax=Acanthamoeba castellanii (strain ATCC 30010 / Neff) TaxID=1257118 RepID=L8GD92_ACACF|nr:uncharacterized protein ACA1_179950 [Acanthamoeba castellanii str. Neff]ELR10834.1 hypothetical protein ACA1_179950 [Acanthamoeba castellanii str. Neff]